MKLKQYLEDRPVDVIHAIFHEQDYYTYHWHFQLVDTMRYYIPDETSARPRIQYACFPEPMEWEIEREGLGIDPPQQWRPYGPTDPCFTELAGGWHAKDRLQGLWEELMHNAIASLGGEVAITLRFV